MADRSHLVASLAAAFTLLQKGERTDAAAAFRAILESHPTSIEARYGLSRAGDGLDAKTEGPLGLLEALAAAADPVYPPLLLHAGLTLLKAQRYEPAGRAFAVAEHHLGRTPEILQGLARCALAQGRPEAAEGAARALVADFSGLPEGHLLLGRALEGMGHAPEAATAYREAWTRFQLPGAGARLAALLHATGENAECVEIATASIQLDPQNVIAWFALSRAWCGEGKLDEADEAFLTVLRTREYMTAREHIIRGVPDRREYARDHAAIVTAFWPAYSACQAAGTWFARARAEAAAPIDAAVEPRPEIWHADRAPSPDEPGLTLVSFGSDPFRAHQHELARSALGVGAFDDVVLWTADSLRRTAFYRDHTALLQRPRGAGCWAWKAFIIYHELLQHPDGHCVIYWDCGRGGGYKFETSARSLAAWSRRNDVGFLPGALYPHGGPNRRWTKRDCFHFMGCDTPRFWDHPQVMATYSVWRNSPQARDFVREWLGHVLDPRLVSDYPNVSGLPNHPDFIDHRNDQSVLTNLVISRNMSLPVADSPDLNRLAARLVT